MKEKEIRLLVRKAIVEKFEKLRETKIPVLTESELRKIIRKKLDESVVSKVLEK